ncbi:MAG: hypothetical protein IPM45_14565 [Acidimicrobiales bacterium]|nr:hypothetical protein [Acidimicrobiales bacterium]
MLDPNAVATDAEGRSLVDPLTGKELPVDLNGQVKYGDTWMSPQEAAERAAIDTTWQQERADGQRLVNEFNDLNRRLNEATSDTERAELAEALRNKAIQLNEDFQAKAILKAAGKTPEGAAFDRAVHEGYGAVDRASAERMNALGLQRGGGPFTPDDMKEFRNAKSAGTVGMDRDYGLDESKVQDARKAVDNSTNRVRQLEGELAKAQPGSPEAERLASQLDAAKTVAQFNTQKLLDARAETRVTLDYGKALDALRSDVASAPPGSPEAAEAAKRLTALENDAARLKQSYVNQLEGRAAQLPEGSPQRAAVEAELAAARNRPAGLEGPVPISNGKWNDLAKGAYGDSYHQVTGGNAEKAFNAVTTSTNVEAYGDKAVLANKPAEQPFSRGFAEQTGSVTSVKAHDLERLVKEGTISRATANQEIARGTAKDMDGKLIPLLQSDPGADPAKIEQLKAVQQVLDRAGKGEIPPGRIDGELQRVTGNPDMTLNKAVSMADANLEAGIKLRGQMEGGAGTPRAPTTRQGFQDALGTVSDMATFDQYVKENVAKGMHPTEAMAVAAAQTQAGNLAIKCSGIDPRLSMVGGALLPEQLQGALPDRMVENTVGTGYQTGRAVIQDLAQSVRTGELTTQHLDQFAEGVVNRPGTDPFKGYGQLAQEVGHYTSGGESLTRDLRQVIETGAGAEVANQSLEQFQQDVAAGRHGPALQGLDHITRIAIETGMDPRTTVGDLLNDVRTIATHGVGDGYWDGAIQQTGDTLRQTPVVGSVVKGYDEIAAGIGERGVGGFASDVVEGGGAWVSQTAEEIGDGASRAANWVRSWF